MRTRGDRWNPTGWTQRGLSPKKFGMINHAEQGGPKVSSTWKSWHRRLVCPDSLQKQIQLQRKQPRFRDIDITLKFAWHGQTPPERFILALHDTTTTQLLKSGLQLKMPLMRVHWCPFPLITTYPVLRVSPLCPCRCSKVDECIAHITPAAEVNRKVHEVIQALAQHCCGILGTCWKFAGNMMEHVFAHYCCCPILYHASYPLSSRLISISRK